MRITERYGYTTTFWRVLLDEVLAVFIILYTSGYTVRGNLSDLEVIYKYNLRLSNNNIQVPEYYYTYV